MKSILSLDSSSEKQICDSVVLIQSVLGSGLLGIYLYGSAVSGGLQRYSDIDLFVVTSRSTSLEEKKDLARGLLKLSGIYMKGELRPLEITIVERSKINPWKYPPEFDFQYGEWLRDDFERGNFQPWVSKEMLDLAILITQVFLSSITLAGDSPEEIIAPVPYRDFILAIKDELSSLLFRL